MKKKVLFDLPTRLSAAIVYGVAFILLLGDMIYLMVTNIWVIVIGMTACIAMYIAAGSL